MVVCVLPVVQQDVRCPYLVSGEAEVFNARVLGLIPLKVMVEPALKRQDKVTLDFHCVFNAQGRDYIV